jgi:hypothetical protein
MYSAVSLVIILSCCLLTGFGASLTPSKLKQQDKRRKKPVDSMAGAKMKGTHQHLRREEVPGKEEKSLLDHFDVATSALTGSASSTTKSITEEKNSAEMTALNSQKLAREKLFGRRLQFADISNDFMPSAFVGHL